MKNILDPNKYDKQNELDNPNKNTQQNMQNEQNQQNKYNTSNICDIEESCEPRKDSSLLTVHVRSVDSEGRGVARDESGRVILVENALPESIVTVKIEKHKKNLAFARCVETLELSPHQVLAKCSYADVCGGCVWQEFD